jgi:hypothetical protein
MSGAILNFFCIHVVTWPWGGGGGGGQQLTLSVLVIGPLVLVALHIAVRGRIHPTILHNEKLYVL